MHVVRAIRRNDRLRVWLPIVLCVSLLLCAAGWSLYSRYQRTEQTHIAYEQALSSDIDSLRAQNDLRQHSVDSLNRLVDSLAVKVNAPSPREALRRKAADLHLAQHAAIRRAVKNGELKTMEDVRRYDGGMYEAFEKTEQSIKDPVLHEEFMQAYYSYFNLNDQLYDSLALILPDH